MIDSQLAPVDALAIGAHPDDIEIGCGGLVARLRSLKRTVGAIDLTRGELGSRGTPERRLAEAAEAARILGFEFRANLGMRDGSLEPDVESRLRLVTCIRACRPKLIITHSATGHPDHWAVHTLVAEASHHAGLAKIDTGQPRHRPSQIAYWLQYTQAVLPTVTVDVTPFYEIKENAIRAYSSQLFDSESQEPKTYLSTPEFLDQIRGHHRYLGNLAECRYAEGFLLHRPPRIDDLTVA